MNSRLEVRPDLAECVLEDRTLPAYSAFVPPMLLTTGGYIVLGTPPGMSSALGTTGGGGSAGGNMPAGFSITGFGMSTFSIGNSTGNPLVGAGGRGSAGQRISGFVIGSGAARARGVSTAPAPTAGASARAITSGSTA